MNIDLFISQKGHAVFACHGEFEKAISQVVMDATARDVKIIFKPDLEIMTMNCPIDEEICNRLKNQLFCAMGYFKKGKLVATEYVRFTCKS